MKRPKVFFLAILSSIAAGLSCPFTLQPQVPAKKKCTSGLVLATPVVFTWGFFPFCQQLLFAAAHKPAQPRAGRLFLSVTNSPPAAPFGLACSTFVSVDKMSERVDSLPLQILWLYEHHLPAGSCNADINT